MALLNRALIAMLALAASTMAPAQEPAELRIAAVGDIMLGGTGTPEFQRFGYDYPFEKTRGLLDGRRSS